MKKIFLFSLLLSLPLVLMAAVGIKDGGKYRIVCQKYATGCLVLGERHDKAPLLFYDTEGAEVPPMPGGWFRNAAADIRSEMRPRESLWCTKKGR